MEENKSYVGNVPSEVFTEKEDNRDLTQIPDSATNVIVEKLKRFTLETVVSKLIILPDDAETMSKGGVYIPDISQDVPARGKVVAVGQGYITASGNIVSLKSNVGDIVIYSKYGGHKFEYEEKEYISIDEKDILAIIKN